MRESHGTVTNYLSLGGNHRRDLEVNSGFSRVYDNTSHRYLSIPLLGMHRCVRLLSLSLKMLRNLTEPFHFDLSTALFSPLGNARQENRQFLNFAHAGDVDLRILCPR